MVLKSKGAGTGMTGFKSNPATYQLCDLGQVTEAFCAQISSLSISHVVVGSLYMESAQKRDLGVVRLSPAE